MDSLSFYITKAIVSIALRRKVLHPFFSTEIIIENKPLFLKMLLLTDECSYNYHYFFFNLKSFKGLEFEHNPIRTHNYIFSLMNTKTASQVAFLRPL